MSKKPDRNRERAAMLKARRNRPGKHLGQMAAEYMEFYNRCLKPPDEKAMMWSTIWRRGGLTSAHMTNIGNNRAGIDKKTREALPFDAIPAETVEKVIKGVGVPELRDWFFSANNVETSQEMKDRQAEIEQDLRDRGILDRTPPEKSRQSKAAPGRGRPKALPQESKAAPLVRGRRTTPPVVEKAAPYEPFKAPLAPPIVRGRTTVQLVNFKMETYNSRLAIDSVTITSEGDVNSALGSLLNIGGNNNHGSDQHEEGTITESGDDSR